MNDIPLSIITCSQLFENEMKNELFENEEGR